jgi:hypothetical protein
LSFNSRDLLDATDTFSGTKGEGEGADETGNPHGGGSGTGIEGSATRRSDGDGRRATRRRKKSLPQAARDREEMERRNSVRRIEERSEGSAARPPYPASIATDDGGGRAGRKGFYGPHLNPSHGHPSINPYGTTRPLYRPPHEFRAPGGVAAAGEGEIQAKTLASGRWGTDERSYSYTRAARAHFSQRLTSEEAGEEPLWGILGREDNGSKAVKIARFLETYGGSLRMREVEWSDASPDQQWSSYFPRSSESAASP